MTDVPRYLMQAGRHNWNLSKSLMMAYLDVGFESSCASAHWSVWMSFLYDCPLHEADNGNV